MEQLRAMLVLQLMEPVHRIDTVAQTEMAMVIPTMEMYSHLTILNGPILILMALETITTMMFNQSQNGTSTNREMRSLTTLPSGIRPVDDMSTPDTDESWPGIYDSEATQVDKFPLDRYQWQDTDGDWIGDEPNTPRSDGCANTWGNSSEDRLGCEDNDGDGWSNPTPDWPAHPTGDADAFPDDPTQWRDSDGDGFGDNTSGLHLSIE